MNYVQDNQIRSYRFHYRGWDIVSQHPHINRELIPIPILWQQLDHLLDAAALVERYTGYKWRITSFLRSSPSHQYGVALDIAPDIHPKDLHRYAVTRMSDPVLYKREPLIRALQNLALNSYPTAYSVGIFIEPDHLHIQLFSPNNVPEYRIFKWKVPKPIYHDTYERMSLPMTSTGYHSKY
jgi:hypothetical protein